MRKNEISLEPFEPRALAAIQTAFRASWVELSAGEPEAGHILRNKLAGTLAGLARYGIHDPGELKRRALARLRTGKRRVAPQGSACTAVTAGLANTQAAAAGPGVFAS
jgi:hypothetical protein